MASGDFRGLSLRENAPAGSAALCSLHSENLKLFCLDHQQPVCVVCRDSKTHTKHRFRPVNEAAQDCREKLEKSLKPSQDQLELLKQVKINWDQTALHIQRQAEDTEKLIHQQFEKLHKFLQEEEEARISALREEEQQKSAIMKRRIEALSRDISALSASVRATKEELEAPDITFLQNYRAAVEGVQWRPQLDEPQLASGSLIDVAKHLGNLTFNIWDKMKDMASYSPVILDPNTAEPHLFVSEDLKSVEYREAVQKLPRNPERFQDYFLVLGSEGFSSGTHSWDVEIRNEVNWAVGVMTESAQGPGHISSGYWEMWFCDGKYRAYAPSSTDTVLSVKTPLRRIRVTLDWNKGKLSFSDPDSNTHIYTFTHRFAERLFPFINTINTARMTVTPVKVTAQLEM